MKHVASIVGVQEGYIIRALQGKPAERTQAQREKLLVHRRFFTCLVLQDLVKENGLAAVSAKYGASKGFLQSLQSAAGTFAGMVTVFCNRLGWRNMETLLGQFQSRLVFGVEKELCDLVKISVLNGARARILYNIGYTSLSVLATACPLVIESVLRKAFPFKSNETRGAHWYPRERRNMSDFEAARLIVHEARELLSDQLNVPAGAVSWDQEEGKEEEKREEMTTPSILSVRNVRKELNSREIRKTDVILSKRLKLEKEDNNPYQLLVPQEKQILDKSPVSPVKKLVSPVKKLVTPVNKLVSPVGQGSSLDLFMDYEPTASVHLSSSRLDNTDPNFLSLSSQYTYTCSGIAVTDLTASTHLLEVFLEESSKKSLMAFSVAVEATHKGVGSNFIKNTATQEGLSLGNEEVLGVAFNWSSSSVYYLSLCESNSSTTNPLNATKGNFSLAVPLSARLQALSDIFSCPHDYRLVAVDFKRQVRYIMSLCHVQVTGLSCDPSVADWMLDPDSNEKSLSQLVNSYIPLDNQHILSLALKSTQSFMRSIAESLLGLDLMVSVEECLISKELVDPFLTVEMPVITVLAKLELNGIGFSEERCVALKKELESHLRLLEEEAFEAAGHSFSLSSTEDVEKVLFHELKLQTDKNPTTINVKKETLEKLSSLHPLPGLILEWRRVSNTLSRTLYPLLKSSNLVASRGHFKGEKCCRLYSSCNTHTATGRVILSDPSIQMIPKEFTIKSTALSSHSSPPLSPTVCVRDAFTAFPNGVFLSADYSQLELRILAHLSCDEKLCSFFNEGGDAFRKIASEWFDMEEDSISDEQRQHTKQICYGIIYGMSAKSLAEQLTVSEEEAEDFMDSFKSKYTGMSSFITSTIQECREKGYIKTLFGRKRFLPLINSEVPSEHCHAERQAVNSMIQGTASDLVKKAMIGIDHGLHKSDLITYTAGHGDYKALLVLQLHDELMYEVDEGALEEVARLVQREMESVAVGALTVKLPVRLKVGKSWGSMESYQIEHNNRED